SHLHLSNLRFIIFEMLRIVSFLFFVFMASAAILISRGFGMVAVRGTAATCADTQSPDICAPNTCKTMPSLGFDMCRKCCGWCDLSEPPCQNAADDGICDAYKALSSGPATVMESWSTASANAPSRSVDRVVRTSWLSPASTTNCVTNTTSDLWF
ncbi:hypothetical protein PMAYCL1PPCAC_05199, partial [Pristionchus mayeri]